MNHVLSDIVDVKCILIGVLVVAGEDRASGLPRFAVPRLFNLVIYGIIGKFYPIIGNLLLSR